MAEVLERETDVIIADSGALAAVETAERNATMQWARANPRTISGNSGFRNEALQLITSSEGAAAQCIFALPRKVKGRIVPIEGPSARFAEIILYSWRNSQAAARIVGFSAESVTAQGVFVDFEKNIRVMGESQRRIVDSEGRRYSIDMLVMTANAAQAIARRNAILSGIPRAIWWPLYESARKLVAGDTKTLPARRIEAIKAFAPFGIFEQQILDGLGRPGLADVTIDDLVHMAAILQSLKDGELTPDDAFVRDDPGIAVAEQGPPYSRVASDSVIREKVESRRMGRPPGSRNRPQDPEQIPKTYPQQVLDKQAEEAQWTPTPAEEEVIRRRELEEAARRSNEPLSPEDRAL